MEAVRADLRLESWPLHRPFATSRETTATLEVLCCELRRGRAIGRAEAAGVDYRGETPALLLRQLQELLADGRLNWDRRELARRLPPGGARNVLDCAWWELEARERGCRAWELAGLPPPRALHTTYTIGLADPGTMAAGVARAPRGAILKLKLGAPDGHDAERVAAVRRAAPAAEIVVDVNEGWTIADLNRCTPRLRELDVRLIEQPLPANRDADLDGYTGALPLCADESFHDRASFASLHPRYACINIKLDKCGGLTEALHCAAEAEARGLELFAGNMLGTSLAMAPAFLLAQRCRWVDLDGPLLLARDREPGFVYEGCMMQPAGPEVWG